MRRARRLCAARAPPGAPTILCLRLLRHGQALSDAPKVLVSGDDLLQCSLDPPVCAAKSEPLKTSRFKLIGCLRTHEETQTTHNHVNHSRSLPLHSNFHDSLTSDWHTELMQHCFNAKVDENLPPARRIDG